MLFVNINFNKGNEKQINKIWSHKINSVVEGGYFELANPPTGCFFFQIRQFSPV